MQSFSENYSIIMKIYSFGGVGAIFMINKLAHPVWLLCQKNSILRTSHNENWMLLRSGRMMINSKRNHNNNNTNNNVANTSTNNSGNNEQNQTNLPFGVSNEMVIGVSHANNNPINIREDVMCPQV